jgi:hypothetical protein
LGEGQSLDGRRGLNELGDAILSAHGDRIALPAKETEMEATQQSVQESVQPAGFEPEIVAFCCEF